MILLITYLILFFIVNAWHDADYYNKYVRKKKVNEHISGTALRLMWGIGLIILQYIGLKIDDLWQLLNLVVLCFAVGWTTFDIAYNKFRKLPAFEKGDSAFLDKIPNWLQFFLKVFLLFISIPIVISFINSIS